MPLRLYNTMSRQIEDFVPVREGAAGLYCCGPTVYNFAHIGNLRTYIFEDLLHRTLVHDGYKLKEGGHTYVAGGNVYFSIDTIDDYGKLAKLNLDDLREGARIAVDSNKRNPKDFVLWFTNSKFKDQVMVWPSPWGVGYPGWHIECSAMSSEYLGPHFDIHCGGIDAIPVHHTNEIAQSEAAFGIKPWVNYWCHGEFLLNDKGKMSKSSGEFLTLSVLKEKGYDPLDYRYFCLTGHYRSQLKFSFESLDQARSARQTLMRKLAEYRAEGPADFNFSEKAASYLKAFFDAMDNDLKVPQALSQLWTALRDSQVSNAEKLGLALKMDEILGLSLDREESASAETADSQALSLLEQRTAAKKEKNWALADELRSQIQALGYKVIDTAQGSSLEKL